MLNTYIDNKSILNNKKLEKLVININKKSISRIEKPKLLYIGIGSWPVISKITILYASCWVFDNVCARSLGQECCPEGIVHKVFHNDTGRAALGFFWFFWFFVKRKFN